MTKRQQGNRRPGQRVKHEVIAAQVLPYLGGGIDAT
jgi:hypothetical protein